MVKMVKGDQDQYWVDGSGNRWNATVVTGAQAEQFSLTLIGCQDCQDCRNCLNCRNCQNCQYCLNCQDCRNCQDCQNCSSGKDYASQPEQYLTRRIGSRGGVTLFHLLDGERVRVICGCWTGSLLEFEQRVRAIYSHQSKHRAEYLTEIEKAKRLWP